MEHVCANCINFEEGICIAHSCNSCEHAVRHPNNFGYDCNDFEPVDDNVDVIDYDDED